MRPFKNVAAGTYLILIKTMQVIVQPWGLKMNIFLLLSRLIPQVNADQGAERRQTGPCLLRRRRERKGRRGQ